MPSKQSRTRQNPNLALPQPAQRFAFDAIGTAWVIELYDVPGDAAAQIQAAVFERIAVYDRHYSRFRPDSLVSTMARAGGVYRLPEDAQPLFDIYRDLYDLTGGRMTPLIGQTLADAGYDAQYSLQPKPLSRPPAWETVLEYDYPQLRLRRPALLDLGAAGKGYLVDIVGALLATHGVTRYCVDAGGDIRCQGLADQPLQIGLEHPADPAQVIGVMPLGGGSVCGSSGNRRAWERYHHIIDPQLLASPRHIAALWVMADTALQADALATALFFVPAKMLTTRYTFEYAIILDDYTLERSAGFPAQFF